MSSYITPQEIDALQDSGLSRDTPFLICQASKGMFSIARHYGGVKFNGWSYIYIPEHDELVRDDIVKWLKKLRSK